MGEGVIEAERHYARAGDKDIPTLATWRLRTLPALSADRPGDVIVDFTSEAAFIYAASRSETKSIAPERATQVRGVSMA